MAKRQLAKVSFPQPLLQIWSGKQRGPGSTVLSAVRQPKTADSNLKSLSAWACAAPAKQPELAEKDLLVRQANMPPTSHSHGSSESSNVETCVQAQLLVIKAVSRETLEAAPPAAEAAGRGGEQELHAQAVPCVLSAYMRVRPLRGWAVRAGVAVPTSA